MPTVSGFAADSTADSNFASDLRRYFGAELQSVATPQRMFDAVNSWGNTQTKGMVPEGRHRSTARELADATGQRGVLRRTLAQRAYDPEYEKPGAVSSLREHRR